MRGAHAGFVSCEEAWTETKGPLSGLAQINELGSASWCCEGFGNRVGGLRRPRQALRREWGRGARTQGGKTVPIS